MAKSVIARMEGDDYQARWFWLQACRLFDDHSAVETVSYEFEKYKGFDDVAVKYKRPMPDGRGGHKDGEYYQLKFHVDYSGAITCASLLDPRFINAKDDTILQRLYSAYIASMGKENCLFYLVSPWPIDHSDKLAELVDTNDGKIRLEERLFSIRNKDRAVQEIKDEMKRRLDLTLDSILYEVLKPLRIVTWPLTLRGFQNFLNTSLQNAGLRPVEEDKIINPYDDLIKKLHRDGRNIFKRDDIIRTTKEAGLWLGKKGIKKDDPRIGIRSFTKWAEYMEDYTSSFLCLLKYFDNRKLKEGFSWAEHIMPEVRDFLSSSLKKENSCELILDVHSSIAFLVGYILNSKSGKKVTIWQKTITGGIDLWPGSKIGNGVKVEWRYETIEKDSGKTDLAVAISISKSVIREVDDFVRRSLPNVGKILHLELLSGTSQIAIKNGAHALHLAQNAVEMIREHLIRKAESAPVHFFISAPNGFTFFLGQASQVLGKLVLYEYDFSSGVLGAYEPSIKLPLD